MRSTDPARCGQSGQSLVEAMVASALLGIVAVVALTTMDTATFGAKRGIRKAWAQCSVRQLANAIEGSQWDTNYGSQDPNLWVTVSPSGGTRTPPPNATQTVTVTAKDPDSGQPLYSSSFLRVEALQGAAPLSDALPSLASGCPAP
jgi:Prokaryotic N-terminal methylation motif